MSYLSIIASSAKGGETLKRLHESNKKYIIKTHTGAKDEYSASPNPQGINVMTFDPNEVISHKKGYVTGALFSLAHELNHADGTEQNVFSSVGESEAFGVNAENYQRSVHGFKGMRQNYDFGWWEKYNDEDEAFNNALPGDANLKGEEMRITSQKILSPIKSDSKSTYTLQTVGTFNAEDSEIKNAKEGIITYFDYKKDKSSKIEKKATIVIVHYENSEKK